MAGEQYPHLFEPLVLAKNTVFRNRVFASATGPQYMTPFQVPTSETISHYERRALGGAAAVCFGDGIVDSEHGRVNWNHIPLDQRTSKAGLCYASDAISRHGAVPVMELLHAGKYAINSSLHGNIIYGASDDEVYGVPASAKTNNYGSNQHGDKVRVYEMPEEVIEATIEKYANAALFAKNCGFGMVNIHGAHGWLVTQFLSPLTNRRKDKWGGSLENRARFAIAVCDAIRKAVGPHFPIEMRFSGSECCPGGYDLDDAIAYAKLLDGHLDLLHVSAGQYSGAYAIKDMFVHTFPSMFSEDGCNVKYAAAIKKHVQMPIATVGALADADLLEDIIASGKADVVEMARQLICDPDTPRKYREGREEDVRKCMRCYSCFSNLQRTNNYSCALNPAAGREAELNLNQLPAENKMVLVVGGGMAGMTAALTAWKRGHKVILCEKADRLGGVLLCEHEVPFKRRLAAYIDQTVRQIERSGIEVHLNTEVTPELARRIGADAIIAALGSSQAEPPVEGIDGPGVVRSEQAFAVPDKLGERVVILGCGLVGAELGIYLSSLGKKVEIVELAGAVNLGTNHLCGTAIELEFQKYGIAPHFHTSVKQIMPNGVICEGTKGSFTLEADHVVNAAGRTPHRAEAVALNLCAPTFCQVGDCLTVSSIGEANRLAFSAAMDIGKKFFY